MSFTVYLFDFRVVLFYFFDLLSSSSPASVERNVRQVHARRSQTDPTRHVAHTKELPQGVREDDQTVPERILITSPTARRDSSFFHDHHYHRGRVRRNL